MSVSITFEPSGISGLVAEGTYLIDAARRMGAPLGAGCTAGKGECPSCVVSVKSGADLLSVPSQAEQKQLGQHPDKSLRLACQVKIENHGEVVVMVATRPETRATPEAETEADLRQKFNTLPVGKKIAMLLQFEAITMTEAFDSALQKPLAYGSKAFDSIVSRTRAARAQSSPKK